MGRRENFHESAGDPIMGWNTGEETVCRDCGKTDPELAMVDPKMVRPIKFSDLGESASSYPDGFTCTSCGDTVGDWDYTQS